MFPPRFSLADIIVLVTGWRCNSAAGAIPPAVPASTRLDARLKRVGNTHSTREHAHGRGRCTRTGSTLRCQSTLWVNKNNNLRPMFFLRLLNDKRGGRTGGGWIERGSEHRDALSARDTCAHACASKAPWHDASRKRHCSHLTIDLARHTTQH